MGIRAYKQDLEKIEVAKEMKGLTLERWAELAQVSVGTLNRFRDGTPISQSAFVSICKAVGIENWEDIVDQTPVPRNSKKEKEFEPRQKLTFVEIPKNVRTMALSKKGQEIVDLARIKKGWKIREVMWWQNADTSEAALVRFLRGQRIRKDIFIALCKAVEINNWEDIVDSNSLVIENEE